jgi:hypothetical protein
VPKFSGNICALIICAAAVMGTGCNLLGKGDVPAPNIISLSPPSTVAGGQTFTLTVTGSGFVPSSQVRWNGGNRNTTYVSASQLKVVIGFMDIQSPGKADVDVLNEIPQNPSIHVSDSVTFRITMPAPVIDSL